LTSASVIFVGVPWRPDEVADAGRLADGEPGLLVQLHLDHDVAGIGLALDDPFLVVADLGDLLVGTTIRPK
jgi:hypothetical protein